MFKLNNNKELSKQVDDYVNKFFEDQNKNLNAQSIKITMGRLLMQNDIIKINSISKPMRYSHIISYPGTSNTLNQSKHQNDDDVPFVVTKNTPVEDTSVTEDEFIKELQARLGK